MRCFILFVALLTSFGFQSLSVHAQQMKPSDPLFSILQKSADSTIVLGDVGGWTYAPNFEILSKKGDTITCYVYRDPFLAYDFHRFLPKAIGNRLRAQRKQMITDVPPDINEYFRYYPKGINEVKLLWKMVLHEHPWQLLDDKAQGPGCPVMENGDKHEIYDGDGYKMMLITKNEIRILDFYAPEFYEKYCPGRKGRKAMIKIVKLLKGALK